MRLRWLSLMASVLIFAQSTSPEQLYREATALYQQGKVEEAVARYELLLKAVPDSVEAHTNLGVALAHLGRYPEAISNYEAALARDRENSVTRLDLALAWYKQFEFDRAAAEARAVYLAHPDNQQALYLLADCYLRLGRNKDVVALLTPLDAAGTEDHAIWYLLGTALLRDGDIEKGQQIIDRILREGDSAEANLLMGEAALAARRNEQALAAIRKAIERNPSLPGAYTLYGRAQMELNDNEAAKASFRKALQADPTDFEANLDLGALLRRDNDLDGAAACLNRALRLRPGSLAARFQAGAVMLSLGNLDEAQRDLETVARDSPDFQDVHVQLAALYYRLGRKADGERERAIVLRLNEKTRQR